VGYGVGVRLLELLCYRERAGRRETRLLDILRFVHSTLWRYLFGRQARDLEQSNTVRTRRALARAPRPTGSLARRAPRPAEGGRPLVA
jgi:hypothetical protein